MVASQENLYKRGSKAQSDAYTQKIQGMKETMYKHADFAPEKKDATFASINRAAAVFGSPKLVESLKNPEFGYDIEIALMLKNIGDALGPEVLPGNGSPTGQPPQAADTEAARLRRAYPQFYRAE